MDSDDVPGWWIFAGILLGISGVLNVIWGIAAISESHFFVLNTHYILSDLKTWGWITLILGIAQGFAAVSLFAGGAYGRWFGVVTAVLVAIDSLLDIPAYPFWSLCVFALSVIIVYQLAKTPEARTAG
ncbi:MAG TPA: hypothetical protein VKG38_02595 [Solirubrobacteraceae bacterium]|nr:hypothetical protein [Solirubrobacteraceae bacterium]